MCDTTGACIVGGILEHVEEAGVHSGDAASVMPPHSLGADSIERLKDISIALAHELKVPLLVTVPRYETRLLRRRERWRTAGAAAIASIVVLAYGFVGWLKLGGNL